MGWPLFDAGWGLLDLLFFVVMQQLHLGSSLQVSFTVFRSSVYSFVRVNMALLSAYVL